MAERRITAGGEAAQPVAVNLSVPFLAAGAKLLHPRAKVLCQDHLVFALYFQSALFLALAASWLVTRLLPLDLLPMAAIWQA